jgi:type IV pilus assembly protein PilA
MKTLRKGFTIVELVIVIAVIAILAGVLIPTFSGVTQRAKQTSAYEEARAALTVVIGSSETGEVPEGTAFVCGEYTFYYKNNQLTIENDGTVDNTPSYIFVHSSYATFDTNGRVIQNITDDGKELILTSLGYTTATGLTVTATGSEPTVKIGDTTNTFKLVASSDLSKKIVVVVPNSSN